MSNETTLQPASSPVRLVVSNPSSAQEPISVHIFNTVLSSLLLYIAYRAVTSVYDVFFGPLSRFPGPKLRAFSIVFEIRSIITGNDNTERPSLHRKYGPIVRVGPKTLSFAGGDTVWKDIHGFGAAKEDGIVKDELFYSKVFAFTESCNLITARDHATHARQRKVLARSFRNTTLLEQQPIILRWAEKFKKKLVEQASVGDTVDILKYYNCTSIDIMGDLTFNEDLKMLEDGENSHWRTAVFGSVRASTFMFGIKNLSWITRELTDLFIKYSPSVRKFQIENWMFCAERLDRRLQRSPTQTDLWSKVLEKGDELDSLTIDEQYANSFLFMTAGTETIASALAGITFHLLRNPQYLEKLTKEIRSTFSTVEAMSLEALASLEYLDAVIQEGLRLYPPLPIALPRTTPKGGAQICGEWIPEGTSVGIHHLSTYTREESFKKPFEFHPQRWLGDAEFENDRLDMVKPFLLGPYGCIGKDLAMHEIRLLLATVLLHFEIELSKESLDWKDMKVFTLWEKRPLLCSLKLAKVTV